MLLSVQEKEKQQCILLQNTPNILLLPVFYKPENVNMASYGIMAISHKPPKGV